MNFDSFWSDIVATVLGGALFTFFFFLTKEKVLPLPALGGLWHFETRTVESAYRPFDGMQLRWVAILWLEGHRVRGTIEKVWERSSTGERDYVGTSRTRAVVDGFLEKRYLGRDRLSLHVVEDGHGRESTTFYELAITSKNTMSGTCRTMVANQSGTASWQRDAF